MSPKNGKLTFFKCVTARTLNQKTVQIIVVRFALTFIMKLQKTEKSKLFFKVLFVLFEI